MLFRKNKQGEPAIEIRLIDGRPEDQYHLEQLNLVSAELIRRGEYGQAREVIQKALELASKCNPLTVNPKVIVNAYINASSFARMIDNLVQAEQLIKIAFQAYEYGKNSTFGYTEVDYAILLSTAADIKAEMQKYSEAEELYKESLSIKYKVLKPDNPSILKTVQSLAKVYEFTGRHSKAKELLERHIDSMSGDSWNPF